MTFDQRQGILISVLTLLQGCSGMSPIVTQTRTVEIPVSVPCRVPSIVAPAWALGEVDIAADVFTKGRAALVEIEQRKAFEEQLAAALAICQ